MKHGKVTREQKAKAVQIALEGGDPLRYLENCGASNPAQMWYAIKGVLKENDPEIYAKIPKRIDRKDAKPKEEPTLADAVAGMTDAAEEFLDKCEEMGLKVNGEKVVKPVQPVTLAGLEITAVNHQDLGEFYLDKKFKSIDWRTPDGEEVSIAPSMWVQLWKELPNILKLLGVEV